MAKDTADVERISISAVEKAIERTIATVRRHLRAGIVVPDLVEQTLMEQSEELTDALLVSYYIGKQQARKAKGFSALETAVNTLQSLFNLTDDAVNQQRKKMANRVFDIMHSTGSYADEKITKAVSESITRQEHVSGAIKRMEEAFKKSGIHPQAEHKLETIFRTQTQMAYSGGRWSEDVDDEMVWGFKYVTVGDDRVRDNHWAMDGVVLPKNDRRWRTMFPPNGYNCRCQAIELFREREIVEPASGAIPDPGFDFNPGFVL